MTTIGARLSNGMYGTIDSSQWQGWAVNGRITVKLSPEDRKQAGRETVMAGRDGVRFLHHHNHINRCFTGAPHHWATLEYRNPDRSIHQETRCRNCGEYPE